MLLNEACSPMFLDVHCNFKGNAGSRLYNNIWWSFKSVYLIGYIFKDYSYFGLRLQFQAPDIIHWRVIGNITHDEDVEWSYFLSAKKTEKKCERSSLVVLTCFALNICIS